MEETNKKLVTMSFLVAGFLFGFVVSVIVETVGVLTTGAISRFLLSDLVSHGAPVVSGVLFFFYCQFHSGVYRWGTEVVGELSKVVWASKKETTARTVGVCIMVFIAGVVLAFFDVIFGWFIQWLLESQFAGVLS